MEKLNEWLAETHELGVWFIAELAILMIFVVLSFSANRVQQNKMQTQLDAISKRLDELERTSARLSQIEQVRDVERVLHAISGHGSAR